jgi:hypothetical protein
VGGLGEPHAVARRHHDTVEAHRRFRDAFDSHRDDAA